jgi:hypothetical protein
MAAPPATITDSRQGVGTLTIGTTDFAAQASAVKLTPTVNSSDGTPTLAVPKPAPETTVTWDLNVDAIQDFEDPVGFVNFLMDNALSELPFVWEPISGAAPSYSGTVQLVPIEVGGDVAVQVVTSVTLPLVGEPTRDDSAIAPLASSSSKAKD